jgi:hypothetical protein
MTPEQYTSLDGRINSMLSDPELPLPYVRIVEQAADAIDALRARVAELEADAQWRPIATAPTIDYEALSLAFSTRTRGVPGKERLAALKAGAEWYRRQMLAAHTRPVAPKV